MKKSFLLFFAIIFLGLAGCSSEDPQPQQGKCLVTKQVNANGNYIEYTYNGNLAVKIESKSANGAVFYRTEYQYNGDKLIKQSQFDNQAGNNVLVYEVVNNYSGNNLVKIQRTNYDRAGKLTNQTIIVVEFDSNGNKVKEISTNQYLSSFGMPGMFESMITYEYQGKLVVKSTSFYKSTITNQFISSGFNSFAYDANGNMVQSQYLDNAGKLISTTKRTYNSANKLLKVVSEQNNRSYVSELHEYDAKNNETLAVFFDSSGKKNYEYKTLYEYDARSNIIKSSTTTDDYFDPNTGMILSVPFTSITRVYTYEYQCPK